MDDGGCGRGDGRLPGTAAGEGTASATYQIKTLEHLKSMNELIPSHEGASFFGAESVGFSSSSYFAKCFKARFGVLPKDYLK